MKIDRETSHGSFEEGRFGCLRSERRSTGRAEGVVGVEVAENTAS